MAELESGTGKGGVRRQRDLPPIGPLLKCPQWLALHLAKARSLETFQVSHMHGRWLGPSPVLSQTEKQGAGLEIESSGLESMLIWNANIAGT